MSELAIRSDHLTAKQREALGLAGGDQGHTMFFGGSRSGKTFVIVFMMIVRALMAPGSRHAIFRFRFNSVKRSIGMDTLPKVLAECFPGLVTRLDKSEWVLHLPNGSEIWLAGLDDKERTEKVLGMEFATIFLNECSQISWSSRSLVMTRLAQRVMRTDGVQLRLKVFCDLNPTGKGHWAYKLFVSKRDPDTQEPVSRPEDYLAVAMNPVDNVEHLPLEYLESLDRLPARLRLRFKEGKFADDVPGALWTLEDMEKWRLIDTPPDMVRIVVAVDPSGSDDTDNADNDEIGIVVAGLGTDGNGYVLADYTVKGGPATWGRVVTDAFDRHLADRVVAEVNYGGAMVKHVIQTARPRTPFTALTASRGKAVRAEPISALAETGRIRHAGNFPQLEDELCSFTTAGYVGNRSPNRADAYVWAFTELFPGLTKPEKKVRVRRLERRTGGWMSL